MTPLSLTGFANVREKYFRVYNFLRIFLFVTLHF